MSVPGGDHAIWIVAAVLYVLDAARLLAPREFLLVEGARGRLTPTLANAPFTLAGRIVAFGPLLRPDRAVSSCAGETAGAIPRRSTPRAGVSPTSPPRCCPSASSSSGSRRGSSSAGPR
jgi:hypothetical protein